MHPPRFIRIKSAAMIALFSAASAVVCSADEIYYAHDRAGRRTARELVISAEPPMPMTSPKAAPAIFDALAGILVTYYPNPTPGVLKVEISGLPDNPEGYISIVSLSGSTVCEVDLAPSVEMDLSGLSSGVYILTLRYMDGVMTYKVIKQ